MPAEAQVWPMDNRTVKWGLVSVAAVGLAASFWAFAPQQEYRRALQAFRTGDLSGALKVTRRNPRWRNNPNSEWFWRFRLLEAESLSAQGKIGDAEKLLSIPVPENPELGQFAVQRLIDQVNLRPGRADASAKLAPARAAATVPELVIRIHLLDGTIALNQRAIPSAEDAFRSALDVAIREHDSYWQAWALNNLAQCSKARLRYEDALDYGTRALTAADAVNGKRIAAYAHGNLGSIYSYLGDSAAAMKHEEQAVAVFREIGAQNNLMIALGELGLLYDRQNEHERAIANYRQAYETSLGSDSFRDAERFAENLSAAYINLQRWDQASEWNEKAAVHAARIHTPRSSDFISRNSANIAYGRGQLTESEQICDALSQPTVTPTVRWEAFAMLGRIHFQQGQSARAQKDFENALQIIDHERAEFAMLRTRSRSCHG